MEELVAQYVHGAMGNRVKAAENFARDLMRGDPEQFKAGYTAENAYLAAKEAFGLTIDEEVGVAQRLGIRPIEDP